MSAPPTGTVTFLFTDIEGSTRLWDQNPDTMRAALARHDALLREAIGSHDGHVFKTIGDAFCAAFDSAPNALAAALAAQHALTSDTEVTIPLRVRMALNTGVPDCRDGDYFGPPLNRVDRLLKIAHGGQILLTQAVFDLVRDALPTGSNTKDLGTYRLRDLQRTERVYQVTHQDLPAEFPALLSLDALPNNLPQQLTRFIGREEQIEEVKRLLETTRLLTLTGSGGCGKTRLALQVAADLLDRHEHGVWLVELASLNDPALVPQAVASTLRVPEEAGRPVTDSLTDHLRDKRMLLLVDNCEHLVDACARLGEQLLRATTGLQILATGREMLGIAGETAWRVPSLTLPKTDKTVEPDALSRYEAVTLFTDRATALTPSFALTDKNAPAVAQICRRLDGIPLAIELAAAMTNVLSPEQVAGRLVDFFRVLTRGSRTALPRHQTLLGAIQWSYDLLTEPQQTLLRRLSVFAGGWDLTAAEDVCSGDGLDTMDVLELLTALVNKSLVIVDEAPDAPPRYRLLETVRQFGLKRLVEDGEEDSLRERHRDYFLALAEEAEPHLQGPEQKTWLDRLEREHDNLRGALQWSARSQECMKLAAALHRFWLIRGYFTEGRGWLTGTLSKCFDADEGLRAKSSNALGIMAWSMGDLSDAAIRFAETLALWRARRDLRGMAGALNNLGMVARYQSDYAEARRRYEESLLLYRQIEYLPGIAMALTNIGDVLCACDDYGTAYGLFKESLSLYEALDDRSSIATALHNLGETLYRLDDLSAAASLLVRALQVGMGIGNIGIISNSLLSMGLIAVKRNDLCEGARLLGSSQALRDRICGVLPEKAVTELDETTRMLNDSMGCEELCQYWENGASASAEQAVAYAINYGQLDSQADN